MKYQTHILFAFLVAIHLKDYFNADIWFVILVFLGSLLPDLDESKSFIGRRVFLVPWLSKLLFGHRGIYRSLLFGTIVGFLVGLFAGYAHGVAIFVGYVSHLLLDGLTEEGVVLVWPLKWRLKGWIKVGGLLEKALFIVILLFVLVKVI
jgi:inner membrane protein